MFCSCWGYVGVRVYAQLMGIRTHGCTKIGTQSIRTHTEKCRVRLWQCLAAYAFLRCRCCRCHCFLFLVCSLVNVRNSSFLLVEALHLSVHHTACHNISHGPTDLSVHIRNGPTLYHHHTQAYFSPDAVACRVVRSIR